MLFQKVSDGLFVGNIESLTPQILENNNITAVINNNRDTITINPSIDVFTYLLSSQELLETEIPKTITKLENIMQCIRLLRENNRNILICCADGKNQSLLVAGYYLITRLKQPYTTVINSLELIYFSDEMKADYADDMKRIMNDSDPDKPPEIISPEKLQLLSVKRAERRNIQGLTMMTFQKILRRVGGARK